MSLKELFEKKGVPMNVDAAMEELMGVASGLGLPMGKRKNTYNSRLAQEMGLWAQTLGKGHRFHDEAFRAYFARGENIARKSVLLEIAESAGLDRSAGEEVMDRRLFRENVDKDWELSRSKGVTAAPTFFMGLDRLVGAQPYQRLEKMVIKYSNAVEN